MNRYSKIPIFLWLAVLPVLLLTMSQVMRKRDLAKETSALSAEQALVLGSQSTKTPSRTENAGAAVAEGRAERVDGEALLFDLMATLPEVVTKAVTGQSGLGHRNPIVQQAWRDLTSSLSPAQWLALLNTDPEFDFMFKGLPGNAADEEKLRRFILTNSFNALARAAAPQALEIFAQAAKKRPGSVSQELSERTVRQALGYWTESDPAAAVHWAKSNSAIFPDGDRNACVALGLMARDDTAEAWQRMWKEGLTLDRALPELGAALRSREDADVAMASLKAHPEASAAPISPELRDCYEMNSGASVFAFLSANAAVRLATSRSLREAQDFLVKWVVEPADREAAGLSVVKGSFVPHSDSEGPAAADWLMDFVPAERQVSTAQHLIENWTDVNFHQAAEWLDRQPASAWRDAGMAALCRKLIPFDAESGVEWADKIGNENLRSQILETVAGQGN